MAETLAAASPKPVVHMPMPVTLPPVVDLPREALGLPGGFVFLLVYDFASVLARKNPVGLIEAFLRAFPDPEEGARLVLKSINSERHPNEHDQVRLAAKGHPHVHLLDFYVSADEKNAMIAAADCYASLHRSEGFGITMAEAMLLGKPVVATAYSGNLDFMRPENSYLVDYELAPIGPGNGPYPPEAEWAEPDLDHAATLMREVVRGPGGGAAPRRDGRRRHPPLALRGHVRPGAWRSACCGSAGRSRSTTSTRPGSRAARRRPRRSWSSGARRRPRAAAACAPRRAPRSCG